MTCEFDYNFCLIVKISMITSQSEAVDGTFIALGAPKNGLTFLGHGIKLALTKPEMSNRLSVCTFLD